MLKENLRYKLELIRNDFRKLSKPKSLSDFSERLFLRGLVENSGFSTNNSYLNESLCFNEKIKTLTDALRTKQKDIHIFANMDISYTTPTLKRGKAITGRVTAAKKREQALQDWYIEYYLTDLSLNIRNRRVKFRGDINKFKDPNEKETEALELVEAIKAMLAEGLHPYNKDEYVKVMNEVISLSVKEAIINYKMDLTQSNTRKKSIQTYLSKLNYLQNYFPEKKINSFTDSDVLFFLKAMQQKHSWSSTTYNTAKVILHGFFEYLIRCKYCMINPVKGIQSQKTTQQSEMHKVFEEADLAAIMAHLKADSFMELFVKSIYYTCARPGELKQLKISMINLRNNTITIPGYISKNRKTETIVIAQNYRAELDKYDLQLLPQDYYLFTSGGKIGGATKVGENTPYNRFMACLDKLNLNNKGYTLYSFKHTANVIKSMAGWKPDELMKANRHSNVNQTLIYLRELGDHVDISQKNIPPI